MIEKRKRTFKESVKDFVESYNVTWLGVLGLFSGYVIGRLTAVKDLQNGKLNMFIPKDL